MGVISIVNGDYKPTMMVSVFTPSKFGYTDAQTIMLRKTPMKKFTFFTAPRRFVKGFLSCDQFFGLNTAMVWPAANNGWRPSRFDPDLLVDDFSVFFRCVCWVNAHDSYIYCSKHFPIDNLWLRLKSPSMDVETTTTLSCQNAIWKKSSPCVKKLGGITMSIYLLRLGESSTKKEGQNLTNKGIHDTYGLNMLKSCSIPTFSLA